VSLASDIQKLAQHGNPSPLNHLYVRHKDRTVTHIESPRDPDVLAREGMAMPGLYYVSVFGADGKLHFEFLTESWMLEP
jgi:hypothetical protein